MDEKLRDDKLKVMLLVSCVFAFSLWNLLNLQAQERSIRARARDPQSGESMEKNFFYVRRGPWRG